MGKRSPSPAPIIMPEPVQAPDESEAFLPVMMQMLDTMTALSSTFSQAPTPPMQILMPPQQMSPALPTDFTWEDSYSQWGAQAAEDTQQEVSRRAGLASTILTSPRLLEEEEEEGIDILTTALTGA